MVAGNTRISLPPGSAVIIEQRSSGVTRVTSMGGANGALVAVAYKESAPQPIKPGEDVTMYEEGVPEEELIPVDGCARDVIVGAKLISVDNSHKPARKIRMTHSRFDQERLAREDALLNCADGCFAGKMRFRMKKLREEMIANGGSFSKPISSAPMKLFATPKRFDGRPLVRLAPPTLSTVGQTNIGTPKIQLQLTGMNSSAPGTIRQTINLYDVKEEEAPPIPATSESPFSPVAFQGARTEKDHAIRFTEHESASLCTSGATRLQTVTDGTYTLSQGEVLVNSKGNVSIKAPHASIVVRPGSCVLVTTNGTVTAVRNLYEGSGGRVKVSTGAHFATVPVGTEVVVGLSKNHVLDFVRKDLVGRRRIQIGDIKTGSISSAEVSLISLMNQSDLLRVIGKSQKAESRAVISKLLKMAACISVVTAGHGSYSVGQER